MGQQQGLCPGSSVVLVNMSWNTQDNLLPILGFWSLTRFLQAGGALLFLFSFIGRKYWNIPFSSLLLTFCDLTSHWTLKAKMQSWVHVTMSGVTVHQWKKAEGYFGGLLWEGTLAGGLLPSFPVPLPLSPDTLQELCGKSACLVTHWVWSEFLWAKFWIWLDR